jgi:thiol-disulfide isomerase/thioredoxin
VSDFAGADSVAVAPDFSLLASTGETVTLSAEVVEQPVILFFWASWCPYCKALMPHLQSIRLEYGDRVRVLAVNFRDDGEPVAYIENAGYDFTVLPNGDDVAKLYDVYSTPGVLIVDAGQRIRFDLRDLAQPDLPADKINAKHSVRAAYRAPYWAAQVRKSLDVVFAQPKR